MERGLLAAVDYRLWGQRLCCSRGFVYLVRLRRSDRPARRDACARMYPAI